MDWEKLNIIKFEGFNSKVSAELIPDGMARDILNFRMEKVGKLMSRDGYIVGLYIEPAMAVDTSLGKATHLPTDFDNNPAANIGCGYASNLGIIGIGEYILSSKWEILDTDRLMIYAIRGARLRELLNAETPGEYTVPDDDFGGFRNRLLFLFSPLTGNYKNKLILGESNALKDGNGNIVSGYDFTNTIIIDKRDSQAQGTDEESEYLYAPNRFIPSQDKNEDTFLDDVGVELSHWIDHYIQMNQYKNKLIISDRTNGDMLLEDEADLVDFNQCDYVAHKLHLRPNCLAECDIDVFEFDSRLSEGQENDEKVGVITGMALYKYVLPKKTQKVTVDNFDGIISDTDRIKNKSDGGAERDALRGIIEKNNFNTLLVLFTFLSHDAGGIYWGGERVGDSGLEYRRVNLTESKYYLSDCYINVDNKYRFTNAESPDEFDDVQGELEFAQDEFTNEDGEKENEPYADVYKWNDLQKPYYPCHGIDMDGTYYLRELDRLFKKLTPGTIKILKLTDKRNAGKQVPLGVWRYKFVWDFGGGIYSAPSAEVLIPDVLWSMVRDDWLTNPDTNYLQGELEKLGIPLNAAGDEPLGIYNRPIKLTDEYGNSAEPKPNAFYGQFVGQLGPYMDDSFKYMSPFIYFPNLFSRNATSGAWELTECGKLFYDIKYELYKGMNHKYGVKEYGFQDYDTINGLTDKEKGELSVLITAFFSDSNLDTKGFIWEGEAIADGPDPNTHWNTSVMTQDWGNEDYGLWDSLIRNKFKAIPTSDDVITKFGRLVVPIFPGYDNYTWNSVFDSEGRLRFAYLNKIDLMRRVITLPGYNSCISFDGNAGTRKVRIYHFNSLNFADYSVGGIVSPDIYFNLVSIVEDEQNDSSDNNLVNWRPQTVLRAYKQSNDVGSLEYTASGIPSEVLDRLILKGTCELKLCDYDDEVYFDDELIVERKGINHPYCRSRYYDLEHNEDERYIAKESQKVRTYYTDDFYDDILKYAWELPDNNIDNLSVIIYGNAERFIGIEQMTSYFPSSLLFKAPRIGIKVEADEVPTRAKRLLIFRSKSSHSNDFQANEYGLVDTVTIERDDNGRAKTTKYINEAGVEESYDGIYYFDKIIDDKIDWSQNAEKYEGLRKELKSRFNMTINERTYFANYVEEYQPIAPRKFDDRDEESEIQNTYYEIFDSTNDDGYTADVVLEYAWCYVDLAGIKSPMVEMGEVIYAGGAPEKTPRVVVLYFMPSIFDNYISKLIVYRRRDVDGDNWYKIGEVKVEDEGVFVDDNISNGEIFDCDETNIVDYRDAIRWSEPYRPDWIKADSYYPIKAGDGENIMGLQKNYGNIVVFKETTCHRLTVQGSIPPISRVDELASNIGLIAPNAIVDVNDTLFFLSWKGFMMWDNNIFKNIDASYDDELQTIINKYKTRDREIRDASCGYNPYYNEVYLNIPMLPSSVVASPCRQFETGMVSTYRNNDDLLYSEYFERSYYGHIYVMNLDLGYSTKYANVMSRYDPTEYYQIEEGGAKIYNRLIREIIDVRQPIRLYFTNSLGEMRSADILPSNYNASSVNPGGDTASYLAAGIYIETPYSKSGEPQLKDYDMALNGAAIPVVKINDIDMPAPSYYLFGNLEFPPTINVPILSKFKSKFFTGNDETMIKRIRTLGFNLFSRGLIQIKTLTIPYQFIDDNGELADDRIENLNNYSDVAQTFNFNPSTDMYHLLEHIKYAGTGGNILKVIPREIQMLDGVIPLDKYNDFLGKPVRFSLLIETESRTQLNAIFIYWRPIHTYLS